VTADRRFVLASGATVRLTSAALSVDEAEPVAERLIEVGRALQPAPVYAFVSIDGLVPYGYMGWKPDFARQRVDVGVDSYDRHVVDAFPWQRLSPTHVAALTAGDDLVGLGPDGGAELRVGAVRAWCEAAHIIPSRFDIPDVPPTTLRLAGRDRLAPLVGPPDLTRPTRP